MHVVFRINLREDKAIYKRFSFSEPIIKTKYVRDAEIIYEENN